MMILQFVNKGSLRNVLSSSSNNILWKDKINKLYCVIVELYDLHRLGYFHKDFHSVNILYGEEYSYISDFGLSKQKSDDKICGILPYIAPEENHIYHHLIFIVLV